MLRVDYATYADLRAAGMSRREIAAAVHAGSMIRARRDRYLPATAPAPVVEAVRIGGRLTCLSLAKMLGLFVFENRITHVHIERGASRLRSASNARVPLEERESRRARLHWLPLARPHETSGIHVSPVDALAHSVTCQRPRHAIATIDSALNKGIIRVEDLGDVFGPLPRKYAALVPLIDGRAQSGTETLMRLLLRGLGCRVELQVWFPNVGYVDLLADGWLVVECDSREFHESWQQQVKDRERDLALAALGIVVLRVTPAQVFYRSQDVVAAVKALRDARRRTRRVHNSA